jgi:hypothetical protein
LVKFAADNFTVRLLSKRLLAANLLSATGCDQWYFFLEIAENQVCSLEIKKIWKMLIPFVSQ